MKRIATAAVLVLVSALLAATRVATSEGDPPAAPQGAEAPGAVERAALAKVDFLVVGADGACVSRFDIQQADGSWRQVMEFRMERVGP
jgi:hypothetical protein